MHSARAMAARCFCPPDRRDGILVALVAAARPSRGARRRSPLPRRVRMPRTRIGASMQLPQHRHVREQVELLEQHPGAQPDLADLLLVLLVVLACSGSASTRSPSISTAPMVGSSRKLMQRRSVVLPVPDRPMSITASRRRTSRSIAAQDVVARRSTSRCPRRSTITSPRCAGGFGARAASAWCWRCVGRIGRHRSDLAQRALQPLLEVAEDDGQHPVDERRDEEGLEAAAVARADGPRPQQQLLDRDDRDQRAVLDHGDELVADGRDHDPDGLRQDDATEDEPLRHAQRLAPPPAGRAARPGCRRGRSRSCTRRS